ncbi:MAG: diguanylate cyclase [Paenisporosarcina sp.]
MKLKVQTIFIIGISLVFFLAFLILVTRPLLIKDGIQLDKIRMEKQLDSLENYLMVEAERLHRLSFDWAVWDDTYNFIEGNQPTYIESNLLPSTFKNLELAYMFFYDRNNQFIYGKGIETIPTDLKASIQQLVDTLGEQESALLANTDNGLVFVDIKETLPSSGEGEPNGQMVMIRYIDEPFLQTLQNALAIEIDDISIVERIPEQDIRLLNSHQMNGTVYIPLTSEGNYAQFVVSQDRDYFLQKSKSINVLFFIFVIMILILIALIYVLMDRLIVSRVTNLSIQLKAINRSKDGSSRLSHSRKNKDEIFLLERTTNDLLESLEQSHKEIKRLAYHDYLTGLPNRFKLKQEFDEMFKTDQQFSLLFLDLDGFKNINDGYGHTIGDMLLKEVALRLTTCIIHDYVVISRFGGDEFIVLAQKLNLSELEDLGEMLNEVISEPYEINGIIARITTSIGISRMPEDSETFDQLIQHADQAMYESKRNGKNQFAYYLTQK